LYFGIFLLLMFLLLCISRGKLANRREPRANEITRVFDVKGQTYTNHVSLLACLFGSLVFGPLSTLFVFGGGIIAVLTIIILFNMPVQIATATSMFMVFFTSVFSTTAHAISGNILWEYTIFFIVGAILGGTLGSKVNQILKGRTLEWILKILIIIMAVQLIIGD